MRADTTKCSYPPVIRAKLYMNLLIENKVYMHNTPVYVDFLCNCKLNMIKYIWDYHNEKYKIIIRIFFTWIRNHSWSEYNSGTHIESFCVSKFILPIFRGQIAWCVNTWVSVLSHCPKNWPLYRNKIDTWRGIKSCFCIFTDVTKWSLSKQFSTNSSSQNQRLPVVSDRNYQSDRLGGQLFSWFQMLSCSKSSSITALSVAFLKVLNLSMNSSKYRARLKVRMGATCCGSAVDPS